MSVTILRARVIAAVLASLTIMGCGNPSERGYSAADEPIRVQGGTFVPGPLPVGTDGPAVVANSPNNLFVQGRSNYAFDGNASKGATGVALKLEDVGTGYWVVPTTDLDPQTAGAVLWKAVCDVSLNAPVGSRALQFVGVTADGHYGPLKSTVVKITSAVPDGFVVVSLVWDSNADLDLHIIAPSGKQLDPKHRNTGVVDGGVLPETGSGRLDRDSNASCVADGLRREDVVWDTVPDAGNYRVLVDEFDACQAAATHFTLTVYIAGEVRLEQSGIVLDMDADRGGPGLFVTDFDI